jgi:hypothetical protein
MAHNLCLLACTRTHALPQCFDTPLVRHLFFWLGFRSITRQEMTRLLQCKQCVAVVPGGVQVRAWCGW